LTTVRRLALVVFIVAAVTWAVLLLRAAGAPERETKNEAQGRTLALVVAFVAGAIAFPGRRG
jgi:hypothetical protein